MDNSDMARAKQIVRGDDTRPRYPDDEVVVVRLERMTAEERGLVVALARDMGLEAREPHTESLRPSERVPLIGDVEYVFPVVALD